MAKKSKLTEEDKTAFREAMRGVSPLQHTKLISHPQIPVPPLPSKGPVTSSTSTFAFSDYEKLEPVSSEETLYYSRPGIQHKILRKLRAGQYNIEAVLDLHGMTVEDARQSLQEFLTNCLAKGLCHVLMIHGKGRGHNKPILKNKLNHWLRQTDEVLALYSAAAKDGGSGALYVLLRRKGIVR